MLILEEYEKIDNRVLIISNENNLGAGESRNVGFKKANAPYVVFLGSRTAGEARWAYQEKAIYRK
jgi:glycosyltransferase involved in cell wall biosynthesis